MEQRCNRGLSKVLSSDQEPSVAAALLTVIIIGMMGCSSGFKGCLLRWLGRKIGWRTRVARCNKDVNLKLYPFQESREIQNSLLVLAHKKDFGPVNLSRETRQSGNTNPREKTMSRSRVIRDEKGLILLSQCLTRGGGPPSKSASQTRAAQQFWPWPSLKGI